MYSPCVECLNRYGRKYTKECDDFCEYAKEVRLWSDKYRECEELRAAAYRLIGELLDKPNVFTTDSEKEARDDGEE